MPLDNKIRRILTENVFKGNDETLVFASLVTESSRKDDDEDGKQRIICISSNLLLSKDIYL